MDHPSKRWTYDRLDSRLRRSPAMCRALITEFDVTLGGVPIITGKEQTLRALAGLGMVIEVTSPRWRGGPWAGKLTPLGRGWRNELRKREQVNA